MAAAEAREHGRNFLQVAHVVNNLPESPHDGRGVNLPAEEGKERPFKAIASQSPIISQSPFSEAARDNRSFQSD